MHIHKEEPMGDGRTYIVEAATTTAGDDVDLHGAIWIRGPRGGRQFSIDLWSKDHLDDEIKWHERVLKDLRSIQHEFEQDELKRYHRG